jgi:hypothetical protein
MDKIKVYNRESGEQVNISTCRFSADLVLWIGDIGTPQEQRYFLSKTDPLGKFKKEMEGWWFCEEYILIVGNVDNILFQPTTRFSDTSWKYEDYYRIDTRVIKGGLLGSYYEWTNMYKSSYRYKEKKDGTIYKDYKDLSGVTLYNEIVQILPQFKKYQEKDVKLNYSSIGEDKYLKLLELINS